MKCEAPNDNAGTPGGFAQMEDLGGSIDLRFLVCFSMTKHWHLELSFFVFNETNTIAHSE